MSEATDLERLRRVCGRAQSQPDAAAPIGFPRQGLAASSDRVPFDPPLVVLKAPSFAEQRAAFLALPEAEQQEQIELHQHAIRDDSRIRPEFSDLLYAMGYAPRA